MSKDKIKRIHRIYGWITAALILAAGIALMISCVSIYRSGDHPFSPESIALHFRRISPLIWLCLAAITGGIVLSLALPCTSDKTKAIRDSSVTLRALASRANNLTAEEQSRIRKEQRLRAGFQAGTVLLILLLALYPAIYFADSSHFTIASLNQDIIAAVSIVLTTAALSLGFAVGCVFLNQASRQREIAVYKQALADRSRQAAAPVQVSPQSPKTAMEKYRKPLLLMVRCVIFLLAVNFIVLGIFNEGILDVLGKAIRICTECIGLG